MPHSLKRDPELDTLIAELNTIADSYGKGPSASSHLLSFFDGAPMPAWIKRASGLMLRTNRAYATRYGVQVGTYTNDFAHWTEETANGFIENDIEVLREGEPSFVIERMEHPITGETKTLFVIKWPLDVLYTHGDEEEIERGATGGFVIAETPYIEDLTPGEIGAEIFIKPNMRWDIRAPLNG